MISIIIPAHNEEAVIGRCLAALLDGARGEELDIVVVCNGCSDRTAQVAAAYGPGVRVIETDVASKAHALNLGDAAAQGFPRFYIDADVVLSLDSLRKLAAILSDRGLLAAAPRFGMNLDGSSWFVRAFYAINDMMPSSREGIGGSGVYGLSAAGRARFDRFPSLTADDGFVRLRFSPRERVTLDDCCSTVFGPTTLWELVRIKTRSHLGNLELQRQFPELWRRNRGEGNRGALVRLLSSAWLWPKLAVYLLVKSVARWRAWRQFSRGQPRRWERDASARVAAALES